MQRIDILWRDIPSQVLIKRGRDRGKYMLSARFQEAIDRAAMRAGKGGSELACGGKAPRQRSTLGVLD